MKKLTFKGIECIKKANSIEPDQLYVIIFTAREEIGNPVSKVSISFNKFSGVLTGSKISANKLIMKDMKTDIENNPEVYYVVTAFVEKTGLLNTGIGITNIELEFIKIYMTGVCMKYMKESNRRPTIAKELTEAFDYVIRLFSVNNRLYDVKCIWNLHMETILQKENITQNSLSMDGTEYNVLYKYQTQ